MKKIALALIAIIMITGAMMAQTNYKKMIIPIAARSSTFNIPVKAGDFVWITADSSLYVSKVDLGPSATGTYLTASPSRYSVGKIASGRNALTATTLNVSGAATLSSTLGVTGNVGIGTTDQNKFVVTGASGNTAIAGTLSAVGNVGIGTTGYNKVTIAGTTGNTAIAGTLSVVGNIGIGTTGYDKVTITGTTGALTSASAIVGQTVGVSGTDTVTAAPVGSLCYRAADSTLYLKIKLTGPKSARWQKITVGK